MWVNPLFREDATEAVIRLIAAQSLATVVAADPLIAGHVPLLVEQDRTPTMTLTGHIPRADPLAEVIAAGDPVLCIFHGARAYVSADWYGSPGLPTYNYSVAHLSGRPAVLDTDGLRRHLMELVRTEEARKSPAGPPWKPDEDAIRRIEALLPQIIGFSIEVDHATAKAKLGQNRTAQDRDSTIAHLDRSPSPEHQAVAAAMRTDAPQS